MDEDKKRAWKRFELRKRSKGLRRQARKAEGATVRHARRFVVNRWDKIRDIRLHIILWLGGVGILIGLVGLQMTWFQKSYIVKAAVSGGTYAEAVRGPIDTLNPLYAMTPAELDASHLLFSSLYSDDATGHLKGDVALTMENVSDKTFTVHMRHDARWHDGQPLTANDVAYTVDLMKSPAVRSVMTASWQGIDVKILDNYTVQFTLPASYAAFPQALTFSILPQHILQTIDQSSLRESSFSTSPVGSGPFRVRLLQIVNQTAGRKIVHMDANKDYYNGKPRLDHIQLHAYNDAESVGQALRTSEVSGASDVSSDTARVVDTKRYDTVIRPEDSGVYALFNLTQPLLKDAIVRKALQLATNTSEIRSQLYGNPKQLYLPFVQGQVAGTEAIPAPVPSLDDASKLLSDNGWVMQNGVRKKGSETLRLKIVTRKNSDYETALQTIATQWRKLGVQVDTQVFDPNDGSQSFTTDILQGRDYDVLLDELQIGSDPDVFAYWDSKGHSNFWGYGNQVSDDALEGARTRSDPVLRAVKYTAFAKQWLSDIPAIGLYQSNYVYVHAKATHAVDSLETIVSSDEHYSNVLNWTAEQGIVYKTP